MCSQGGEQPTIQWAPERSFSKLSKPEGGNTEDDLLVAIRHNLSISDTFLNNHTLMMSNFGIVFCITQAVIQTSIKLRFFSTTFLTF